MIEVARPAFLWAGAVLSGLPLLLHFLRPRQRRIRPLPTARFLTEDSRTLLRMRRRPDELLLLAIRMSLCLMLGAVFAGLSWVGPARGTGHLVVVDGSPEMAPLWNQVREAAVTGLPGPVLEILVVRPGVDGVPTVERLGPDELSSEETWAAGRPPGGAPPAADETGALDGGVRLAHLIRALRDGAGHTTGADSLGGRIVTLPRWSAWGPGMVQLREELWPGRIELVVPDSAAAAWQGGPAVSAADPLAPEAAPQGELALSAADPSASDPDPDPPGLLPADPHAISAIQVHAPEAMMGSLLAAVEALGLAGFAAGEPAPPGQPVRLWLSVGPEEELDGPWISPASSPPSPSPDDPDDSRVPDAFLLLDGRTVPGAGPPPGGTPEPEAVVPVLRIGGRPAAAAARDAQGCRVALPLEAHAPVVEGAELVVLLESLLREGCGVGVGTAREPGADGPSPDRAGAREAWERFLGEPDRPELLEARPLRYAEAGFSLTRLLLLAALGLALLEVLRARQADRARSRMGERGDPHESGARAHDDGSK